MRLIGSDGLFAFCVVVCVCFLTDVVLSGRVLSHVVYCFFILIVFECIMFLHASGHTVVVLSFPEVLFVFCCRAVLLLRLNFGRHDARPSWILLLYSCRYCRRVVGHACF